MDTITSRAKLFSVAIVDDHPVVRQGLAQAVARDPSLQVCVEASGIVEALQQLEGHSPDVFVIDITLDGESGIDLIERARSRDPAAKILVYSSHDEETFAARVVRAGAVGYISKREPMARVINAIHHVLRGEVWLSLRMAGSFLHGTAIGKTLDSDPATVLSERELQIFQLIGDGLTTVQIAGKLQLSPKTVESHRKTIKQKLNLRTSSQLSRSAFQWGMENH